MGSTDGDVTRLFPPRDELTWAEGSHMPCTRKLEFLMEMSYFTPPVKLAMHLVRAQILYSDA